MKMRGSQALQNSSFMSCQRKVWQHVSVTLVGKIEYQSLTWLLSNIFLFYPSWWPLKEPIQFIIFFRISWAECNQNLKDETFCNIMQFLITSIKKDKQMEALVDKLCNRFAGVNDVRQWEYISYCLSQLTFTEKGLKKLIDNFKMFEHALSEDSVMNHFRSVISKVGSIAFDDFVGLTFAKWSTMNIFEHFLSTCLWLPSNQCKKFAKPELKVCIEEFEEKLGKVHQEKKEQEETTKNAEAHRQRLGSLNEFLASKEVEQSSGNSVEEETSEVVDPSVDSSTEDKEKTPECSDNISTGNCQTSTTFTESEDGSEEIQSTRPVRKGDSWFQIWYPQNTWSFLRNFHVLCRLVTIKGKENQRSCFRGLGRQCSS